MVTTQIIITDLLVCHILINISLRHVVISPYIKLLCNSITDIVMLINEILLIRVSTYTYIQDLIQPNGDHSLVSSRSTLFAAAVLIIAWLLKASENRTNYIKKKKAVACKFFKN